MPQKLAQLIHSPKKTLTLINSNIFFANSYVFQRLTEKINYKSVMKTKPNKNRLSKLHSAQKPVCKRIIKIQNKTATAFCLCSDHTRLNKPNYRSNVTHSYGTVTIQIPGLTFMWVAVLSARENTSARVWGRTSDRVLLDSRVLGFLGPPAN